MKKLNICIDIDGTITSPYHFLPYLNEMFNRSLTEKDYITLDWKALFGNDIDEMLNKFHNEYLHAYEEAEVVENAKEIIKELSLSNNVYFVTARSENIHHVTEKWLNEKGLSEIGLYSLGSDHKIETAKNLKCDIFIEDNPWNAVQIANEGIDVLLVDANYNKDVEHERITRVKDWNQIKELILNKY